MLAAIICRLARRLRTGSFFHGLAQSYMVKLVARQNWGPSFSNRSDGGRALALDTDGWVCLIRLVTPKLPPRFMISEGAVGKEGG